jgi:hypothetical protein
MDSDLWKGKRVIWRHKPRGGYGYVLRIPVTIDGLTKARATIRLETGEVIVVPRAALISPPTMRGVGPSVEPAPAESP